MARPRRIPGIAGELSGAELGDERLTTRLTRIASTLAAAPADSLPRLAGTDGELEGVYRFFSNERVSPEKILAPHFKASRKRAAAGDVLVLHDTTSFCFRQGSRVGLGHLHHAGDQSKAGFFGHFAFAVAA